MSKQLNSQPDGACSSVIAIIAASIVLKSVGGFLATQVAVYAWNYLSTLSVQHDGSGSSGLEEECRIFMELEGC